LPYSVGTPRETSIPGQRSSDKAYELPHFLIIQIAFLVNRILHFLALFFHGILTVRVDFVNNNNKVIPVKGRADL
jgi:hypothetical protein